MRDNLRIEMSEKWEHLPYSPEEILSVFGWRIKLLMFQPITPQLEAKIEQAIREATREQLPRIHEQYEVTSRIAKGGGNVEIFFKERSAVDRLARLAP